MSIQNESEFTEKRSHKAFKNEKNSTPRVIFLNCKFKMRHHLAPVRLATISHCVCWKRLERALRGVWWECRPV